MNNKKRFIKIVALLLCTLMLTGCWNSRELDSLAIVLGYAVDKSSEEGMIDLTAQIALIESGGGGSSSGDSESSSKSSSESFWNITGTGKSIFSIVRDFTHKTSRKLYSPHCQVIIFGNDLAKEGIRDYLDLFFRDHETRLTVYVVVARDRADEILNVKPKITQLTSLSISELIEDQGATSETVQIRVMDFLSRLISETTAPIAPIIEVEDESGDEVIKVSGTAVFKDDKMVGELNNTETRGLLWVLGQVKSGAMTLDSPDGEGSVEIEIISVQSSVEVELNDDGSVSAHVKITESGNIAGQIGAADLSKVENIDILEESLKEAIANEVLLSIQKAKELDADVYGFGEMVYKKYPQQWEEIKGNWDELFKNMYIDVEVEASIKGSGRIIKPAYPAEEEE